MLFEGLALEDRELDSLHSDSGGDEQQSQIHTPYFEHRLMFFLGLCWGADSAQGSII